MRLIDADALDVLTIIGGRMDGKVEFAKAVNEMIQNAPTVDAEPVRHGKWLKAYGDHEAFGIRPFYRYCSCCNEATVFPYNYCPNCGARMDAERKEEWTKAQIAAE